MKIRSSTSLTAAACALCVVAASGTMAPHAVAARPVESAVTPTVSRSYELTAVASPLLLASLPLGSAATPNALVAAAAAPTPTINDVLALASLPVQNLWTIVTTFGQLTNFATPLNKAMALVSTGLTTGNWDVAAITAQVQAAIDVTITAIRNIINLPATIISKDVAAIGNAINPTAPAAALPLAAPSAQVAAAAATAVGSPSDINRLLTLASLPAQNAWTVVTTFGQLTNFATPLNKAMALVVTGLTTGKWDVAAIGAQVQSAFDVTVTAVRNIVNLPATIINYDIQTIGNVLNPAAQTTTGSVTQALRTATTAELSAPAEAGAAAPVKEKHTWESLQTTVRSDFESEIAAFDGGLPTTDEAPAVDAPTKDAPAEVKDPANDETATDAPAKDASSKDGKDSDDDKKTEDKKSDDKDKKTEDTKDADKKDAGKVKDASGTDAKDGEKASAA